MKIGVVTFPGSNCNMDIVHALKQDLGYETIELWHKIKTIEDSKWTNSYHNSDPNTKSFGGRVKIFLKNGTVIEEEKAIADAHPNGERTFERKNYIEKFQSLTDGIISTKESNRFLDLVQNLIVLKNKDLNNINLEIKNKKTFKNSKNFIF